MLVKKRKSAAASRRLSQTLGGSIGTAIDRRSFLKHSGLAAGGAAVATALPIGRVRKATAATAAKAAGMEKIKSVCTHCSVGCTVVAEVQNGVSTVSLTGRTALECERQIA